MVSSYFYENTRWISKSFVRSKYCKRAYDDRRKLNIVPKTTLNPNNIYAWRMVINYESVKEE